MMVGESKTRGIVQLKTDFRSLKYADSSPYTEPLHHRDINGNFAEKTTIQPRQVRGKFAQQYRQYFKNQTNLIGAGVAAEGHSRIDDFVRIAKFVGTPKGLLWEMHQAALNSSQLRLNASNRVPQGKPTESEGLWSAIKSKVVGVLKNAGQTALDAVSLTAGTLMQTALSGTGYHHDTFISRAYLVKGTKNKAGNAILNAFGITGNKINGGAAVAAGARKIPNGIPEYTMLGEPENRETVGYSETEQHENPGTHTYVSETPNYLTGSLLNRLDPTYGEVRDVETDHLLITPELQLDKQPEAFEAQQGALSGKFTPAQEANVWYGTDYYRDDTGTRKAMVSSSVRSKEHTGIETVDELKSGSYISQVNRLRDLNDEVHPGFGNSRFGILADLLNQKASAAGPDGEGFTVVSKKHDFLDRLGSDKDQPAGYVPKKYDFEALPHSAVAKDGTQQRIADSEGTTAFNGSVGKVMQAGTSTHTRYGYSYLNELDGKTGDRAWVRTRLDSSAENGGKIAGDNGRQKDQSKIPVEAGLAYKPKDDLSDKLSLIPFCITSISPETRTYLTFEANLDSYDDSFTGNWNGTQYVGRAEQFYNYTGFNRDISFAFKIVARKADDLKPLYQKLNVLCSSTAPTYDSGKYFMRGTLGSITVGDLVSNQIGFFKSVKISWKTDYPWEIGNVHSSWLGQVGTEIIRVPHLLDVSVNFTPIHYFNTETANLFDRDRIYFGKKYE